MNERGYDLNDNDLKNLQTKKSVLNFILKQTKKYQKTMRQ